jgi:hypothetical protein
MHIEYYVHIIYIVIRSISQVSVIGVIGLKWRVNSGRFKIVAKNLLKSSKNIVLMSETMSLVANVVLHLVEIKQEVLAQHVNPQFLFIDLCNSFDEDGMLTISVYPSKSSLHMIFFLSASTNSPYSSIRIPCARGPSVLSGVDCLKTMSLATHVTLN